MRLDLDDHGGALFPRAGAERQGRGQAARRTGAPRDPLSARQPDARPAPAIPRPWRGAKLSLADQGPNPRRLLDRVGRAGRGDHVVRQPGPGLSGRARPARSGCDRANDRADGRCRTRRGQHLRSADRGLQARRPQLLVDRRLQPPVARRDHRRPDVPPLRRHLRDLRLAGADAQVRQGPARRVREARRQGAARLDRHVPQRRLCRADLPGRGGVARTAAARRRQQVASRQAAGQLRRCRAGRADDQPGRALHRDPDRSVRRGPGRPPDDVHRLYDKGLRAAVRWPQGQPCRADEPRPDRRAARRTGNRVGRRMGAVRRARRQRRQRLARGARGLAARGQKRRTPGRGGSGSGALRGARGNRAIDPSGVRKDPVRAGQVGRSARRPDRHHLARRHRLDQSRRVRQPARAVPPPGAEGRVPRRADSLRPEVVGRQRRSAHRAGHRRKQPFPHARRAGSGGTAVRHPAAADWHGLRSVHRARARCAQLRLLPGCAVPAGGDAGRADAGAGRRRAPVDQLAADRDRPAGTDLLRAGLCR